MKDRELREEVQELKNELIKVGAIQSKGWIFDYNYVSQKNLVRRVENYNEACIEKCEKLERKINAILEILDIEEKRGIFLKKGNKEVEI